MVHLAYQDEDQTKNEAINVDPTFVENHLIVDPRVCHGALTFRGTRVLMETILYYLGTGHSLAHFRRSWPEVSPEAIAEADRLASERLIEHYRGTSAAQNHAFFSTMYILCHSSSVFVK
jgi:uncharacterized protein (DUF433 family)